ncbi:MAG: tetratricopeptide repeat protein [Deltaproteobacteria bacterium]|nr:tetratricopeptide repeat protein [Deltaproteobacteria bacterium]
MTQKTAPAPVFLLLAVITFLLYIPALHNGFVNWDDPAYVLNNPNIRSFGIEFLRWAFTTPAVANWHPLTMVSHAMDYRLWGLNPAGHHLTSVALHSANAFLVALVVFSLFGFKEARDRGVALGASFLAGLFFAVHPLRVESVAWVSERKDVLCAFFFLLSVYFYVRYLRGFKWAHYIASLALFALALISKPMAITLPLVLLIIDYYPAERFKNGAAIIVEKIPFFFLSGASALATVWAQKAGGAIIPLERYPLYIRVFSALRAYIFYLYKTILPVGLAPYYPRAVNIDPLSLEYLLPVAVFAAITVFCVLTWKRRKLFLSAWLYYLITLLPVIGIVQAGGQAAADRYTYLPGLSIALLAGAGGARLYRKAKSFRPVVIALFLSAAVFLSLSTFKQIQVWKDEISFWSHEIRLFPTTVPIAYINRGMAYEDRGLFDKAIEDYTAGIALNTGFADSYVNRGSAYNGLGEYQKAIEDFNRALELKPDFMEAYYNRGLAELKTGDFKDAINDLNEAIRINPEMPSAYDLLSEAYSGLGEDERALEAKKKGAMLRTQ